MRAIRVIGVLVLAGASWTTISTPMRAGEQLTRPRWGRDSTVLEWDGPLRCDKVRSPDGLAVALAGPTTIDVLVKGKLLIMPRTSGVQALAELSWATDSTAFAVTQSDGGELGTWYVVVYRLQEGAVVALDVTAAALTAFKREYSCIEPEEPNVGAVTWANGSRELIIATEVPPHSTCPQRGMLRGYVVNVTTGAIVTEVSEGELRAKWGPLLGARLAHASSD
jgi:hypothetical protein